MKRKTELKKFFVCFRNGTAFISSWLLVLYVIYSKMRRHETVRTDALLHMILWSAGISLIFALCFTECLTKHKSFTLRLAVFMTAVYAYDHITFTLLFGIPFSKISLMLIILLLFLSCIAVYAVYSRRKGEIYTKALHDFQQKRRMENGEQNSIS